MLPTRQLLHLAVVLLIVNLTSRVQSVTIFTAMGPPAATTQTIDGKADEAAIWIDREDPTRSVVIGNDKDTEGGLFVFDLEGNMISQTEKLVKPVGLSVRYDFKMKSGERVDVVATGLRTSNEVKVFKMDKANRKLVDITAPEGISSHFPNNTYGICLYRKSSKELYAFVSRKLRDNIHQIKLEDDGYGRIRGKLVRKFGIEDQKSFVEGLVVDDDNAVLYAADEQYAVFKYMADLEGSSSSSSSSSESTSSESKDFSSEAADSENKMDKSTTTTSPLISIFGIDDGISRDREGLALYSVGKHDGYLVMSNQGSSTFNIYERGGNNRLVKAVSVPGVTSTDGIAVTSQSIQPQYPKGMFVAHNDERNNLVFYDWGMFSGL